MKLRTIGLATLAAAAIAPSIAGASSARSSFAACANAFVASLGSAGKQAPKYQMVYRDNGDYDIVSRFYATEYTVDLNARDRKTGARIAHATCRATASGVVTSLTVEPLAAGIAGAAEQY